MKKKDLVGEDPCGSQFYNSSQGSDAIVFPLFDCCSLFTPDPVVNYSKEDRWWTEADPFDASHPSIAPCSLPTSKSCQSSQLHRLLLEKRLLKHLSVDRWSGRSLTWPALLQCSTIQAARPRFRFKCALWIHPSSPPSCFPASVFKVQRLLHWAVQRPQVCLEWMRQVFFWCCSASILGPPKESSSTSVNCATQHKRLALQLSLSLPIMFLTSPLQFSRGTGRSQNGKLPPCIGRHWMIIMAS